VNPTAYVTPGAFAADEDSDTDGADTAFAVVIEYGAITSVWSCEVWSFICALPAVPVFVTPTIRTWITSFALIDWLTVYVSVLPVEPGDWVERAVLVVRS
jgi:hypothetical protein